MNIVQILLDKFKENPIKIIGLVLTYLGLAILLTEAFLYAIIMVVTGPILLIISWIVNKEFIKKSFYLIIIGGGWFVISVLGIGFWLANIMIYTSLALIALGITVPIVGWIINKTNGK